MAPGFADTLLRLLRSRSEVVPVSRLKRRGLRQVTVLDFRRLQEFVAEAVDRALAERAPEIGPEALAEVRAEAREGVLRLVHERDRLRESADRLAQEKRTLERHVEELRRRLEEERARLAALSGVSGSAPFAPRGEADLDRLEERVLEALAHPDGNAAERIRKAFEDERRRARRAGEESERREIERLERRISKLAHSLERSEALVERLRREVERPEGIASEFREVQGLDPSEPRAAEKRGLLEEVFRWNVELRDWMQRDRAGAGKTRPGQDREATVGDES